MKYGIREICNVVFRAANTMKIGSKTFQKGQPVLFMDSAKTSTLEGAATSVYATGGRGNTRLVTWEGEKTLTFTVEDALLSPISFSMLSGAGVVKGAAGTTDQVHAHTVTSIEIKKATSTDVSAITGLTLGDFYVNLTSAVGRSTICDEAPIFVMETEMDGSLTGATYLVTNVINQSADATATPAKQKANVIIIDANAGVTEGQTVIVDYYVLKNAATVTELQIDAEKFGGYFYVEADTLFRSQIDGTDYPANITLPNVKIQSNWTFSMAATGDPSTFSFTMDAMLGYTYFDKKKKVLCVIQVIEENEAAERTYLTVMGHTAGEKDTIEGLLDKDIFDDLPNTGDWYANKNDYTRVAKTAKWINTVTYYTYNSNTHAFSSTGITGDDDFATKVAAGLYTKNS